MPDTAGVDTTADTTQSATRGLPECLVKPSYLVVVHIVE
jgi:hypothetical protein